MAEFNIRFWFESARTAVIQRLHHLQEVRLLELFCECFIDEDDRNESSKALLREAGDVAHKKAEIKGDNDEEDDTDPDANPKPKAQVVPTELPGKQSNVQTHQTKLQVDTVSRNTEFGRLKLFSNET